MFTLEDRLQSSQEEGSLNVVRLLKNFGPWEVRTLMKVSRLNLSHIAILPRREKEQGFSSKTFCSNPSVDDEVRSGYANDPGFFRKTIEHACLWLFFTSCRCLS